MRVLRRRVAESRSSCMTGSQWLQLLLAGFFMLLLLRAAAVSCPKLLNSFIEAEKKILISKVEATSMSKAQ